MPTQKFRVYLAGPISGCNPAQIHRWRDEVKQQYGEDMEFIDPSSKPKTSSYAVVKADVDAIAAADGLLVNMWRESIGSAIGIVHAHRAGRPVVVADPNHINNLTLKFYAAAIEDTPLKAAKALLHILRADANWKVSKAGAPEKDFSREKLANSLRAACRRARRNSIVVPVLVLPKVIALLSEGNQKSHRRITTADISTALVRSLRELEASAEYEPTVRGILQHWQARRSSGKPSAERVSVAAHNILIASGKSHSTIWGHAIKSLKEIPSEKARQAFQAIGLVPGVARISLGHFSGRAARASFCVTAQESKQDFVIEGKMFDNSKKGTMQTFQVLVHHAADKPDIVKKIAAALQALECWAD